MKKKQWILVVLSLFLAATFSVMANAAGPPFPPEGSEANLLARYLMENQAAQVLAELTKQPLEGIRLKLCRSHLPDVLEGYKIDPDVFHKAMRAKLAAMIAALEKSGFMTPDQGRDILAKMEKDEERHALVTRLIEKGIKDGSITLEQARLLLPQLPGR